MATPFPHLPCPTMPNISRPIDRLPTKRLANEQKEAMNCKNCRKRKIKCNRMKPKCEACIVFKCQCIYDAVPKKRGPKTDVLECLLKRVNGLEKRLQDEGTKSLSRTSSRDEASESEQVLESRESAIEDDPQATSRPTLSISTKDMSLAPIPPPPQNLQPQLGLSAPPDAILDAYFARVHEKPYYILDEAATRSRLTTGRLPPCLVYALYAVTIQYVVHGSGGPHGASRACNEYTERSRAEIDVDEPSIDHLQALLLLSIASFHAGKGRKSYMLLSHAISIAFALDLHRELPAHLQIPQIEREGRRKLFWTCYLMDRFTATGGKRPTLILDEAINLCLPARRQSGSHSWIDGPFFSTSPSRTSASPGSAFGAQGSGAMLVEITRILGCATLYLSLGGARNESHFPWHSHSGLSKIRADLDHWAFTTHDTFASLESLFSQADSSVFVLSKLIFHVVHCLIYRPFLPVLLSELVGKDNGGGFHQSWQAEATNMAFTHANAIVELVECAKGSGVIDWPAFVGYCICTAGTIHVHGSCYDDAPTESGAFDNSLEYLSREITQLEGLRFSWAGAEHHRNVLRTTQAAHIRLSQAVRSEYLRLPSIFQMDHFFDRYPGLAIDDSHVTFEDNINRKFSQASISNDWSQQQQQQLPMFANHRSSFASAGQTPFSLPAHSDTTSMVSNQRRHTNSFSYPNLSTSNLYTSNRELTADLGDDFSSGFAVTYVEANQHNDDDDASGLQSSTSPSPHLLTKLYQTYPHGSHFSPGVSTFNPILPATTSTTSMGVPENGLGAENDRHDSFMDAMRDQEHVSPHDDDPFLILLEELAATEGLVPGSGSRDDCGGRMSDLDFFMTESTA